MIFKNCTFCNDKFEKDFADIRVDNGIITKIGHITEKGLDMRGKVILPGFIDIHIHGAAGGDFSDAEVSSIDKISIYLAKHGVTSFCGTTMTLPKDKLKKILLTAKNYHSTKSKLVGINLEGPFISYKKRGSQNGQYIRKADFHELSELFDANDNIKLLTVAPETIDDNSFIEKASKMLTVSIGHTNAKAAECKMAINEGAKHITHLFNAMTPMHHRDAGVSGTALDNDNVTCELVCDGKHICPEMVRIAFKILGENRAVVVSDSMRAAGFGEGEFELGGQKVFVKKDDCVAKFENLPIRR